MQVGASIMFALSRSTAFPFEGMQRGLILRGGAAGIAAAFNAPLAGIVFAIEEMARSFEQRTISIVVTAVIVVRRRVARAAGQLRLLRPDRGERSTCRPGCRPC